MTTANRTETSMRIGTDGVLRHRSETQNKEFTGFTECQPEDLGQPLAKTLGLVSVGSEIRPYWIQGDNQASIGRNIDNLKSMIRSEPNAQGAVLGDTGFVSVYTCPAPQLVG